MINETARRHWTQCTLADIVQLKTGPFGSALHKSDYITNGTPSINPTHIKAGKLVPDVAVGVSTEKLEELSEYRLREGDVIIGRRGEMGRCAVVPPAAAGWLCGTGSVIARPSPAITPHFLQRFLSSPETIASLNGDSIGSTMVNLNQNILLSLSLALPPMKEQQRIANQLDTLLARVQACNDRFDAIPALLKRFRQAVLTAAVSGAMGSDASKSKLRKAYPSVRLSEVAQSRLGKMLDKRKNTGTPTQYIGNINVRWFSFDLDNLQLINIEDRERAGLEIRDGDVFICEGGEPGRCAIWNAGPTQIVFQKALHRVRPFEGRLLPQWLVYCIRYMTDSEQISPLYTGTTIRHLTGSSLSKLLVPLPSVEEQTEIIRRVEALFALADRIEARCTAARAQAQRLSPLVLAKAFRGELVPQDPSDEFASALLARIASSNTAVAGKSKKKVSVAQKKRA